MLPWGPSSRPIRFSRRDALRAGVVGVATIGGLRLSPPTVGQQPSSRPPGFGRAKRCILLFLTGGPPQLDTWDMKPDAPADIRGEFKPIATNVPGLDVSELFPHLARQADKLCVVRSVTHGDTVHTSAGYTMLTGMPHPLANVPTAALIKTTPDDHPHPGALLAKYQPRAGTVSAVSLPEFIRDAGVNDFPGQDAGLLGKAYAPLLIEADAQRLGFKPPPIVLPGDVDASRLVDRDALRRRVGRDLAADSPLLTFADLDAEYGLALDVLRSDTVQHAFAWEREPEATRAKFGEHLFGKGCLLARRLVEAGVGLVTVYWHYEGPDDSPVWDTHWNNFTHLRSRLAPPADMAIAALLDDLSSRGLLDDTLLICMGEFGRTPRVNAKAGRDHWPHAQTILLAGAGVPSATVYGSTDRHAAYPAERPVAPADLTATLLHLLGISPEQETHDRAGRPIRICRGTPITGLL